MTDKIQRIKDTRNALGCSLFEAKRIVEREDVIGAINEVEDKKTREALKAVMLCITYGRTK